MKFMKVAAAALCALGITPVMADSIDINLHDMAIRGTYTRQIASTQGLSNDYGILHVESDTNNDIPPGESESLFHVGLLVSGDNWSRSGTFNIGVGGRIVYATPGDLDMLAIAFGGNLRFSPVPRLGIGGHAFFSPQITSFADSEAYQEVGLRVDYQLLPQAYLYVGHRNIKVDFGAPDDWVLDDEVHGGMKLTF